MSFHVSLQIGSPVTYVTTLLTLVCFIQKLKDSRQGRLWYYHIKGFFFWTKFGIVNGALAEQNFDEATIEEPLSIRRATDV